MSLLIVAYWRQILRHSHGSTLAQVMTAPSHYLDQYWLITSRVMRLSPRGLALKMFMKESLQRLLKFHKIRDTSSRGQQFRCGFRHDDVIKWKHFSTLLAICAWNSPFTGEFPSQRLLTRRFDVSLICDWINGWVNNREAGDLRLHRAHNGVTVIISQIDAW